MENRHVFIVSRDQPALWEHLRREFSDEESVEVVLDRRCGRDRRSGRDRRATQRLAEATTSDRRASERRARNVVDTELRSIGFAMVRLPLTRA